MVQGRGVAKARILRRDLEVCKGQRDLLSLKKEDGRLKFEFKYCIVNLKRECSYNAVTLVLYLIVTERGN